MNEFKPDLVIGTTPVVQKAKELAIPALYFTNLISARPLMGAAGAGSLAQVINAALANQTRFDAMNSFFEGVGKDHATGVWESVPVDHPEFKADVRSRLEKAKAKQEKTAQALTLQEKQAAAVVNDVKQGKPVEPQKITEVKKQL